jgi:hypothetical protein
MSRLSRFERGLLQSLTPDEESRRRATLAAADMERPFDEGER